MVFAPSDSATTAKPHPPTVAVTGAGGEIGRAVSMALAAMGVEVVMLDRQQGAMAAIYDQITGRGNPEPLMVEFDLHRAGEDRFDQLHSALADQVPALHGLMHCAMESAPLTPVALASPDAWERILKRQLVKPIALTRALYPLLKKADQAAVVFSTLDCGTRGRAYWGAVGAAHAGLLNAIETMNEEWANSSVTASAIDCSRVKTAVRKRFYPAALEDDLTAPDDPQFIRQFVQILDFRF